VLVVNHYYTKSREDWLAKIGRGKADALDQAAHPYPDSIYYDVERDAKVEDRNALRFVPRLKAMLQV
jgi:hypothetical protein